MNDTIKLVTIKPDAELAAELKQEIIEAYQPVLAILEKAKKAGFEVQCTCEMNWFGQMVISKLVIIKCY